MKDFVLLFRRDYKTPEVQPTAEQLQESLTHWQAWWAKLGKENKLARPVQRLDSDGKIVRQFNSIAAGPYMELKESVGGYLIIQAEDYDEAVEIAKECPVLDLGGNVEVRMGM